MILIVSENTDHSTSEVIQWLRYYKAQFVRFNQGDTLMLRKVVISNQKNCKFVLSSKERGELDLDRISAIWYRRGSLHFCVPNIDFIQDQELKRQVSSHLKSENNILEDYLQYLLHSIPHIGTFATRGVNKLVLLDLARKIGIDVPDTYIVSESDQIDPNEKLITKSISEIFNPTTKNGDYITYTESLKNKPKTIRFFPSLFQTHIEKEADIRIFVLRDKVYSMAIMSQNHPQTAVDFRKYLSINPSRQFSFKLPNDLEMKLIELIKKAKLETASIDMILTKDGRFVFLEANPIGQFGMTSKPCNFFLEREIALSLMDLSKQMPYEKR